MRKAFNFYKSHWEQIKLLNDSQKLDLFNAICSVQFLEVHIDDVTFKDQISTLVWTGIKHSLSTSISGFVNKNKALDKGVDMPLAKGGAKAPMEAPCQQLKEKEEEEGKEEGKEKEEEEIICDNDLLAKRTIAYLNQVANKKFGTGTGNLKEIKSQINKLKKNGDDLKQIEEKFAYVINVKAKEWLNDTNMKKHLNPVTLFRESNFDKYLNQDMTMNQSDMIDAIFDEYERRGA